MGRLEELIRRSDEIAGKLRFAHQAVRQAQGNAEAAQAKLTEAVRALRARKDEFDALLTRYKAIQTEVDGARQQYARLHSTSKAIDFGPLSQEDRLWLDQRLAPPRRRT